MKNLLVVVDYQKDFVDGALGFPEAVALDTKIAEKVKAYAQVGDKICVTYDTHSINYLQTREGKALPVPHCIRQTDGWKLFGETGCILEKLQPIVIEKSTFGVSPQDMVEKFSGMEFDKIEFCGLVSNICVISNICCFQARFPEAQMVLHTQLTASFDREIHEKTLDVLRGLQVQVV